MKESVPKVVTCSSPMPLVDEHVQRNPYDEQQGGIVSQYGEILEWLDLPPNAYVVGGLLLLTILGNLVCNLLVPRRA